MLEQVLGIPTKHLEELAEQEANGNNVAARLNQLNLPRSAFLYLMRVHALLSKDELVLESEWQNVYSILVAIEKRRASAEWNDEERIQRLILGPDHFSIPPLQYAHLFVDAQRKLPNWRAEYRDLREWERKLNSRIDQQRATVEALLRLVRTVEEETLPRLRDSLLSALDKGGQVLSSKRKWVAEKLLIDAEADGCRRTTRVAQAIETLQTLLWSARSDRLKDAYPKLELIAERFDEEAQWIGSYPTWRAATFVFMYPQNILLPSLRKRQTPQYWDLWKKLRRNRRLTRDGVCEVANEYIRSMRDISKLVVDASCREVVIRRGSDECDQVPDEWQMGFFMFGRATKSGKAYWSNWRLSDDTEYAQEFWREIPRLRNVSLIVAAVPHGDFEEERFIYLFAVVNSGSGPKLVYTRYGVFGQGWDEEPVELEKLWDDRLLNVVEWQYHHSPSGRKQFDFVLQTTSGFQSANFMPGKEKEWWVSGGALLPSAAKMKTLHAIVHTQSRLFICYTGPDLKLRVYEKTYNQPETIFDIGSAEWAGYVLTDVALHVFFEASGKAYYQQINLSEPIEKSERVPTLSGVSFIARYSQRGE